MSFLNEAFQELNLLEGEDFSLDKKGLDNLKGFLDADDDIDFVNVIDTDAETQEECEDKPHVGMTILCCDVCNTLHYKNSDEVVVDEETHKANVGESCPYCFSADGFTIVGKVAPFEETEVKVEEKPAEVGAVVEVEETNESLKGVLKGKKSLEEGKVNEFTYLAPMYDSAKSFNNKASISDDGNTLYSYNTKVISIIDGKPVLQVGEDLLSQTTLRHIKEFLKQKGFKAESKQQVLKDYGQASLTESKESADDLTDEEIYEMFMDKLIGSKDRVFYDEEGKRISPRFTKGPYKIEDVLVEKNVNGVDCIAVKASNKALLKQAIDIAQYYKADYEVKEYNRQDSRKKYGVLIDYGSADLEKLLADDGKVFAMKKKGENLEKDQQYPIKSPLPAQTGLKDNGALDLSKTEAGDPKKEFALTEDMKEKNKKAVRKILARNKKKKLSEGIEGVEIKAGDQVIKVESKKSEEKETIVPPVEEEHEEEIEVEGIDESCFNELGQKYLKRVYENVQAFRTTGCKADKNKLIVEGQIKFTSGKKAKTSFIFEAKTMTKRGNARFTGLNENLARGKNSYTLTGKIKDKKLMIENFNYNYLGRDASTGKSKRLYGTVRKGK